MPIDADAIDGIRDPHRSFTLRLRQLEVAELKARAEEPKMDAPPNTPAGLLIAEMRGLSDKGFDHEWVAAACEMMIEEFGHKGEDNRHGTEWVHRMLTPVLIEVRERYRAKIGRLQGGSLRSVIARLERSAEKRVAN